MSVVLFLDANQYLNFYRMVAGRKLLASLGEQRDHIFVSAQVADEARRNSLSEAAIFFASILKEIDTSVTPIPDHLFGVSQSEIEKLRDGVQQAKSASNILLKLAGDALQQISSGEDHVSEQLKALFDAAVAPSSEEMQRARDRKEKGNRPGKKGDPLGDQITWEQLLTHCRRQEIRRAWIITDDRDFITVWKEQAMLNPVLKKELMSCGVVEIRCFNNLLKGIQDFAREAGVAAKELPTPAESAEIEKEIAALPPQIWSYSTDDAANVVIRSHQLRQQSFNASSGGGAGTAITILLPTTTEKVS